MKYQWVLFDADETLFHFDAYEGLRRMLEDFNISFTREDFAHYQKVNLPLWVDYQDGKISAQTLQETRFIALAEKAGITPHNMNQAFLNKMADVCYLLPGAQELLNYLKPRAKLGIITNGFTQLQEIRLEKNGLSDMFDILVISEEVGTAKPAPQIFEHAYRQMGEVDKSRVLMVGDNPDSDVLGGQNFGFDTCWLNHNAKPTPDTVSPVLEVKDLTELHHQLKLFNAVNSEFSA